MYSKHGWPVKGIFTLSTIFVSPCVARQHPTKLGSILTVLDAVVWHGAAQKIVFRVNRPQRCMFDLILISVSAVTFLEYWKRKSASWAHHWDCMGFQARNPFPFWCWFGKVWATKKVLRQFPEERFPKLLFPKIPLIDVYPKTFPWMTFPRTTFLGLT
jgi:hypothetical protein